MYKCVNKPSQPKKKKMFNEKKVLERFTLPFIIIGWNDVADAFLSSQGERVAMFCVVQGGKMYWWEVMSW